MYILPFLAKMLLFCHFYIEISSPLHASGDLLDYNDIRPWVLRQNIHDGGETLYRIFKTYPLTPPARTIVAKNLLQTPVTRDISKKRELENHLLPLKKDPEVFYSLWLQRYGLRSSHQKEFMTHARTLFKTLKNSEDLEIVGDLLRTSNGGYGKKLLKRGLAKALKRGSIFAALEIMELLKTMGTQYSNKSLEQVREELSKESIDPEAFWAIFEHREKLKTSNADIKRHILQNLRTEKDAEKFLSMLQYVTKNSDFIPNEEAIDLIRMRLNTAEQSIEKALLWNGVLSFEVKQGNTTKRNSSTVQSFLGQRISHKTFLEYVHQFKDPVYMPFLIKRLEKISTSFRSTTPQKIIAEEYLIKMQTPSTKKIANFWWNEAFEGDWVRAEKFLSLSPDRFVFKDILFSRQKSLANFLITPENPLKIRLLGARFLTEKVGVH